MRVDIHPLLLSLRLPLDGFRTTWKCREVSKHITLAGWNIKGYWLAWERAARMSPVLRQAGKLNFPFRVNRLRYLTLVNITWQCVLSKGQVRWFNRPTVSFTFKQHKSFLLLFDQGWFPMCTWSFSVVLYIRFTLSLQIPCKSDLYTFSRGCTVWKVIIFYR